ncbi:MAG: redoxin domain-containing protein, partial [Myxococcota bacterium]|nr:redoxin domain-containing protein [Myxococcota bacterium]
LWQTYKDQGLVVWGIGSQDDFASLEGFTKQMGLTFPVLWDDGAEVKALYDPGKVPTNSVYPQDWIVGVDGTIVYVNTTYEPDEMAAIIEDELAKMTGP